VLKWLLAIFIFLVVVGTAGSWLSKIGIGRLPGDVRFPLFGKQIFLPFTSTIVLSLLLLGIQKMI
jgi:Protein of unknown function (DUF2905)